MKTRTNHICQISPARVNSSWLLPLGLALVSLVGFTARADTTVLSDSFSGTAGNAITGNPLDLNNTGTGAGWLGSSNAVYSGSSSGSFSGTANALITVDTGGYVVNNPGVYTLSLSINNGGGTSDWYGFGWSDYQTTGGTTGTTGSTLATSSPPAGYAWLLLRGNGQLNVYGGPGTGNPLLSTATGYLGAGVQSFSLVLDTTGASYALNAFVNGTQLDLNGAAAGDTYTYTANPTAANLEYLGISSAATTPAVTDSFGGLILSVQSVPEPSTLALFAAAAGALSILGRKNVKA